MKLASVGIVALLAVAGCSHTENSIDLATDEELRSTPTISSASASPEPTPTKTWTPDEAAAIDVAQRLFSECMPNADKDPMNARKHLEPCAAGDQLEELAGNIGADLDEGFRYTGAFQTVVHDVEAIQEDAIEVRMCLDDSAVKKHNTADNSDVSAPIGEFSRAVGVIRSDGEWRVWGTDENEGAQYCENR